MFNLSLPSSCVPVAPSPAYPYMYPLYTTVNDIFFNTTLV